MFLPYMSITDEVLQTVLCSILKIRRLWTVHIQIKDSYRTMTSSNGNIFRVTDPLWGEFTGPGEFPTQRPVTRSFDVFFDLRLNKRLSKQPWGWWFETPSWSLWRQCNVINTDKIWNLFQCKECLADNGDPIVKIRRSWDMQDNFILDESGIIRFYSQEEGKLGFPTALIQYLLMFRHDFFLGMIFFHYIYSDIILSAMASQITGISIVCSTVCSCADQRKHQSSAALASVRGIHRWPVVPLTKGQ